MNKLFRLALIAVLGVVIQMTPASAQHPSPIGILAPDAPVSEHRFWLGTGYGGARSTTNGSLAAAVHATYAFGNHTISLRHAFTHEPLSFGALWGGQPDPQIRDTGLLYGHRLYEGGGVFVSAGAGLAVVSEDHAGAPIALGLPVEFQVSLRPTRWVGLGIYAFGNANGTQSFAGAGMGLQLGLVR